MNVQIEGPLAFLLWAGSAGVAAVIWHGKGGWWVGAFLASLIPGPFAIALAYFGTPAAGTAPTRTAGWSRSCPHCRAPMPVAAQICDTCQETSEPMTLDLAGDGRYRAR